MKGFSRLCDRDDFSQFPTRGEVSKFKDVIRDLYDMVDSTFADYFQTTIAYQIGPWRLLGFHTNNVVHLFRGDGSVMRSY